MIHVSEEKKQCSKCKEFFMATEEFFNRIKTNEPKLRVTCKKCISKKNKDYKEKNKEREKKYREGYYKKNKEIILKKCAIYRSKHKERRLEVAIEYNKKNKKIIAQKKKIYREKNKDKAKSYAKQYIIDNKEKIAKRSTEHYAKNKEKIKKYRLKYAKKNKDKISKRASKRNGSPASYSTYHKRLSIIEDIRESTTIKDAISAKCAYCGAWFIPKLSAVTWRINAITTDLQGEGRLYCSDGCKSACPTYKRIKYPKEFKVASSREANPVLRQIVLKRDGYCCQKCDITISDGAALHCHHITPATQNPMTENDPDVCITLCKKCHKLIHQTEGCKYYELRCKK